MDGLALLCNLHADGPLSLRRLRRSGVDDLEDLGRQSEAWLATTLKSSPSQVRRFLHEGRLLARRLDELPLESEHGEDAPVPPDVRARLLKPLVRPPVAYDLSPPDPVEDEPYQHEPDLPAEPGADGADAERDDPPAEATGPTLFDDVSTSEPPRRTPPEEVPLRVGGIPGLDSRTCQQLVAQGVRTYQALTELANLNLARRTGIPFTRLLDLRHHARTFLRAWPVPRPSGTPAQPDAESEPGEAQVELVPQPRRVAPPPASSAPPAPRPPITSLPAPAWPDSSNEPGVAGPFV